MTFRLIPLLWLLAAIPFIGAFLVTRERTRAAIARRFASERLRGVTTPARPFRPWLLAAGLALAIVALAGPFAGYTLVPLVAREANRIIVLDVSNSMSAEDVGTSRLAAAKALAMRLSDEQEGRAALIVFEAEPDVLSPLTSDTAAVSALIDSVVAGEVGEPGSDVGSAILAALRLIESEPAQRADIVVISDGEDQGTRVAEAVQRARLRGAAVSTIVIGSGAGSTIPTANGPLRDTSGELVTTFARNETMAGIARDTGGQALVNPFAANGLDALMSGVKSATPRQTEARVPIDRYQWPLALAFFALFTGSLLNRGAE
jgi:Ca-activated chloride channel family protein